MSLYFFCFKGKRNEQIPPLLRYRVVARAAPRMAAKQTADGEIETLDRPMLTQCLDGILRTGGGETTGWRLKGREAELIEAHQQDQREGENTSNDARQPLP